MERNKIVKPADPGKPRHTGIVKWFSSEKGFGFIETQNCGDIFVYYSDIVSDGFKTLEKNQAVSFDIAGEDRGPKAVNVKHESAARDFENKYA